LLCYHSLALAHRVFDGRGEDAAGAKGDTVRRPIPSAALNVNVNEAIPNIELQKPRQ
jgi:hypothetical protein